MVRPLRVALIALLLVPLLAIAAPPRSVHAADFRAVQDLTIGAGEVLDDDLYVLANSLTIDGRVTGDVFVLAQAVVVRGEIGGSLNAGAASVVLAPGSRVAGSARVAASSVEIAGSIGRDLLAGSESLQVAASGQVGGALYAGSSRVTLAGSVGRDAAIEAAAVTVSGPVGGNLRVNAQTLDLLPSAAIAGGLVYTDGTAVSQATGSRVAGPVTVVEKPQAPPQDAPRAERDPVRALVGEVIGRFIAFLMGLLVGAVLIGLLPRATLTVAETFRRAPWWSLLTGFVALLALPIVAIAFAVTIIGLPLALLTAATWLIGLYLAPLAAGFVLAWLVLAGLREPGRLRQFLLFALGLAVVSLLTAIPFAGGVIGVLLAITGLGAILFTGIQAANQRMPATG